MQSQFDLLGAFVPTISKAIFETSAEVLGAS
jgi:hypothetical protein